MRRTSALIPALNALLTPSLRSRRDPDGAFGKILDRVGAGDHVQLGEADTDAHRRLLRGFAAAPGLSGLGWAMARGDIQARITNQLRVRKLHDSHPEIGSEVINAPVVIVGLPRTGTTVTHKVISQSFGHRAPALWELMHTDLELPPAERDRLMRQINATMTLVTRLAPAMRAIHPQRAEAPDEDPFALPHGAQHLARAPMPDYERWCYERDYSRDYDYLKRVYQVLQHDREPRRWVIKSPTHLANLDQLIRVFPNARIVWLHRDPATVIGSICSLVETSWRLHVRRPDLHEIGRMCLRMLRWMVERARAARLDIPREQIVDIPYHAVASEPERKMPVLYDRIGARWTDADAANLAATMARPYKRAHEYGLARYGLDHSDVESAFGDYSRTELQMSFG